MKTAISIPHETFEEAETLAKRLGVSRSRLYSQAIGNFVAAQRKSNVTERLNAIYARQDSRPDPAGQALQWASIPREAW